ncbi:putative Mid2 domain-containing protein [Seiridium cardinale]
MRKSTVTLIASWLYGQGVLGFDNKFLFPTDDDLTFYYMNTIEVEYQSNFTNPTLYTFCKVGDDDPKEKDKNTSAPKNNGTVSVTLDFQQGDECWFNLREDEKTSKLGINSPHNWKFDADDKNTTTVKAPETTTSSTSSKTSSTISTTSTSTTISTTAPSAAAADITSSATPTPSSTPTDDDVGAKATRIGIGVGVGFAGLLVMTVMGMVVARILRKRRNALQYASPPETALAGIQKPASAVSYNPVSQFEPSGAPYTGHYDPYRP